MKSVSGLVSLFIRSETGRSSWEKLKEALVEGFYVRTSRAEICRLLEKQNKREETLQEYFFVRKEITSRSDIDYDWLMQDIC